MSTVGPSRISRSPREEVLAPCAIYLSPFWKSCKRRFTRVIFDFEFDSIPPLAVGAIDTNVTISTPILGLNRAEVAPTGDIFVVKP
jgi:hypothetical protein